MSTQHFDGFITDELVDEMVSTGQDLTVWDTKIPGFCVSTEDDEIKFQFEHWTVDLDGTTTPDLIDLNTDEDEEMGADEARIEAAGVAHNLLHLNIRRNRYLDHYNEKLGDSEKIETVQAYIDELLGSPLPEEMLKGK